MKRCDLTGQKFNKLTVMELSHISKMTYWKCQCECGNLTVVSIANLKSGRVRSCGCLNYGLQRNKPVDLLGQKFGRLTVLEFSHIGERKNSFWKCKCDCGNIHVISNKDLKNGVISCGCYRKEANIKRIETHYILSTYVPALTQKVAKNNTSGHKGVSWEKSTSMWVVSIGYQNRIIRIGRFSKLEDAIKAREAAEIKYFYPIIDNFKRKG